MMMMTEDPTDARPTADSLHEPSTSDPMVRTRPSMTLHRGRIAVAAAGAVAFMAALVTLVLGVVGIVPFLVPLACVLAACASVVVLRVLAVRRRRARVQQAFAHAMSPIRTQEIFRHRAAPAAPDRPTSLFDAEDSAARPLSAMELRTAALAAVRGSSASSMSTSSAVGSGESTNMQPSGSSAWVPVEVPRPTYVDSAKAEREAPAPLDLPEAPRATTKTPIKASEAAARMRAASDETAQQSSGPATGRINLDDVLQRRRA